MAKIIDEQGIVVDEIPAEVLQEYKAYYQNEPVFEPVPFTAATVGTAVLNSLMRSPQFGGVRVDLVKKEPDATKIFVMVSAADSERKAILADDALVQLIDCPSSACP
ncbi:hypothetical protein [Spirosoma montaniterrae]|uniref:Uncharacterized protein n=1 Tax=Spirosoma montaniterrae TaxID=1178516 RepID=A0A1P9WZ87_9BACT|nr:hypothetical protein [Spirosoma montaniterrae]AQG80696.1 hypothetical protein AWR27_15995 [Spirosoma montaniterrae]